MSTEEQDWDLQAAEYVLGTLSDQDQTVYDALYRVDEDWQLRVHRWQARLNPLNALTKAVEPPSGLLSTVMARINELSSLESSSIQSTNSGPADAALVSDPLSAATDQVTGEVSQKNGDHPKRPSPSVTLNLLRERVRYWKFATAIAVASMVGILILAPRYLEQRLPLESTVRTVAVLQSESSGQLWVVTYLPDAQSDNSTAGSHGAISVTTVGDPQLLPEQSHQLWMVLPEDADVRSVGLVPDRQGEAVTLELPVALAEATEFAISLEPQGGVPGPEHGPVVTRTFILRAPE